MHRALRVSLAAVLATACAPTAAASAAAPSSDPVAPEVTRVLRDCREHRDTITIRLDPAQLLAVYREYTAEVERVALKLLAEREME